MDRESESDKRTLLSSPKIGLSLGWRLALSTVLIISLVMGGISIGQQLIEFKEERQIHQELLNMSLAPLAVRLEAAMTLDILEQEIEAFHSAYTKKGYPAYEVYLLNADNDPVISTGRMVKIENSSSYLQAAIPISSPQLIGGSGTLMVQANSAVYRNKVYRDWLLWAIHFSVTVSVVFLFLNVAIYFQVTKPVSRLVRDVKKIEKGYWGPIELTGGAWELRWLAWRFGNMVQEVQSTMTHLFEAEQKARSLLPLRGSRPKKPGQDPLLVAPNTESDQTGSPSYNGLLAVCERLESQTPDSPQAGQLGRGVWQHEALEADRLGFHQLKVRLENAALQLMEPDVYKSLDDRISTLKASRQTWAGECRDALYNLLDEREIPCVGVLYRVKHTAGVWAKMQSKGLGLNEIHDLFAFRVIVPTEPDCYAALGVIHQTYKPVVSRFKDYIVKPKGNNYRSLHTCVSADNGLVFEVQIRSVAMDCQAERGHAAHWRYKKSGRDGGGEPAVKRWWQRPELSPGE
ncbi:MAG: hypothetical protein AAES65_16160 [Candidatus Thiodiazotropha sp. (ex. Lucinoma kazani)]